MKRLLMVIAKRPAAGQTKTRLRPRYVGEQAARLYEAFLLDTLQLARSAPGVARAILYWPPDAAAYFTRLAPDFALLLQSGNSLGERLDNAFIAAFRQGYHQVVIMDSDSPTLPPGYIAQAFARLHDADVALGPCDDGGYYLIGLAQPRPALLRTVPMSTPTVLQDTLAVAAREGLRVALLPAWYDVDTPADMDRLQAELAAAHDGEARNTKEFITRISDAAPRQAGAS